MSKKIVKLLFLVFCFSQFYFAQENPKNKSLGGSNYNSQTSFESYKKHSVSFDIGGKDGVRYPGVTSTRITQINSYVLGYRYMFNNRFGISPEFGWERFKDLNDSVGTGHYMRFSMQTCYNLTDLLRFNSFSKRLGMLAIAGAGYSICFNPSGVVSLTDTSTYTLLGDEKIDKMLSGYFGARVMFKCTEKFSIHSTLGTVFNLRQDRTFDGQRKLGRGGFTGKYYNLTLGATLYLGKQKQHADWYSSKIQEKDNYLEISSQLSILRKSLEDDDADGVINAVDVSPNTPEGTLVDLKGVPLTKDTVSLGNSLKLIEGIDSLKNGDSLLVIQLINEFSNEFTTQLNMLKKELESDTLHHRSNSRNSDDFDNDGLNNSVDICPYIKGQSFGCPDSDNDGIPDFMDACPELPGTLKFNGCSEGDYKVESIVNKSSLILEENGVYDVLFEINKSELLLSSKLILDRLVKLMNNEKDLKIIISGHADKTGNKENNEKLSRQRAETCQKYLVSKGIEADRLIIEFYGSEIEKYTSNGVDLNLANRRVSFRVK